MLHTSSKSLINRLTRGLGAHGIMQVVLLLIRIAEAPLFLAYWGPQAYGEWLMLAALPTALALSDGGFTKAASREMAIRISRGDERGAKESFQSGWLTLTTGSILLITTLGFLLPTIPLNMWPYLSNIPTDTLATTLLLLSAQVIISFQCNLLYGAFASTGKYATGTLYQALFFTLSFAGLTIGVIINEGLLPAAIGGTLGSLLGYIAIWMAAYKKISIFRYGWQHASRAEVKRLFAPSFANLAFPIAETLNNQGLRLVIGVILGPITLAMFTSMRTLCRVALQPTLSIARTVEPEMSLAYGSNQNERLQTLLFNGSRAAIWLSLTLSIIIFAFGSKIFKSWTNQQLPFDWTAFTLLIGASFLNASWSVAMALPVATNRHGKISFLFATIYGSGSIILAWLLTNILETTGAALSLILIEIVIATIVINESTRMISRTARDWFSSITQPPPVSGIYNRFIQARSKQAK